MSVESGRERIEVNRRTIEINDPNGDKGAEERVEYADGSWVGRGEITEGTSKGHKWLKGEGGSLNAMEGAQPHEFFTEKWTGEMKPGRWGVVIEQGANSDKPKNGDTWLHASAKLNRDPGSPHDRAQLVERPDATQIDEQTWIARTGKNEGDEVYRLTRHPNGEVVVTLTETYYEPINYERSFVHRTSRHLDGPRKGHTWEEREIFEMKYSPKPPDTGKSFSTPEGRIDSLRLKGWSRDLVDDPEKQKELPVYLKLAGEWVPAEQEPTES